MSREIRTTMLGKFISNKDLQLILLSDGLEASHDGEGVLATYIVKLVNNLQKLEE